MNLRFTISLLATLVFLSACKSSQISKGKAKPIPFYSEKYNWRMDIPAGWEVMSESRAESLTKKGRELIKEEGGDPDVEGDGVILKMEHGTVPAQFFFTEFKFEPDESIPFHQARMERFKFYKRTYEKVPGYEVNHLRSNAYLGHMYFEVLAIEAVPPKPNARRIRQTVLETLHNGQVITLTLLSRDSAVYAETLEALFSSGFGSTEPPPDYKTRFHSLPETSIGLPKKMTLVKDSVHSKTWVDKTKNELIEIKKFSKASTATMKKPRAYDNATFMANLNFGLDQTVKGVKNPAKTKQIFVSGKRCLTGHYQYERHGEKRFRHYLYVVGHFADYSILYDHADDPEIASQTIRQITSYLREEKQKWH